MTTVLLNSLINSLAMQMILKSNISPTKKQKKLISNYVRTSCAHFIVYFLFYLCMFVYILCIVLSVLPFGVINDEYYCLIKVEKWKISL